MVPMTKGRPPIKKTAALRALAFYGTMTTGEVREAAGYQCQEAAYEALSRLCAEGIVLRSKSGGRGAGRKSKTRRWRLAPDRFPQEGDFPVERTVDSVRVAENRPSIGA